MWDDRTTTALVLNTYILIAINFMQCHEIYVKLHYIVKKYVIGNLQVEKQDGNTPSPDVDTGL